MQAPKSTSIRRRKTRTDDGKGVRRMIAGLRFRAPAGIDVRDADQRFSRIEDLWRDNEAFCRRLAKPEGWTEIALWAAELLRRGELRIPLPPVGDILASFEDAEWPMRLKIIIDRYTADDFSCRCPSTVEGLEADEARHIYDVVSETFPSVNWQLPESQNGEAIQFHEAAARWSLKQLAAAKNHAPPDPATPLIDGTFHEALSAYEAKREKDFTLPDGTFDGSGHHFLGIIKAILQRRPDFRLAELDFGRCQEEFVYWRDRPEDSRKNKQGKSLTKKTCQNYIGELGRFFEWLHLTNEYGWRKPQDFSLLKRKVRALPTDRRSVNQMEIPTFSIEELTLLYKHAIPFERFLLVWCLNCAHGAAEIGRVEWGDLFLRQEHPWKKQGLQIESSDADNWCGFTRPKSDVLGWWLLWPETVQLLEWWRSECRRFQRRESRPDERVLLTNTGAPLYRDQSRNAQSGFANAWKRLRKRIKAKEPDREFRPLPFGTLRDQLSDWLGGDQAKAVVASVALCHGIPHRGDKLLYRHYANRPWGALFQAQREYREHLKPMFDAVPDPLYEHDPVGEKVRALWTSGIRNVAKIADCLEVSEMTVRRRMAGLGLSNTKSGQ